MDWSKKKGLKVSDVQIKINGDLLQQKFHPILDAPFYKDQLEIPTMESTNKF